MSWIKGYSIPFKNKPFQCKSPPIQNWSNSEIIDIKQQLNKLLNKKVICECEPIKDQFISSFFLVPKPDGSKRLIINLKRLNEFVNVEHFKIEDTKVVTNILYPGDFMITLDLTDAYYMMSVKKSHRKYLRIYFLGKFYEFVCLPFGLCSAPYVFTKIMKPVILYLRFKLGLLSVVYLDDFLLLDKSYNRCLKNLQKTVFILESLGFLINKEKSCTVPSQVRKFLGLIFDSKNMQIQLPEDKKSVILNQILKFERLSDCKIRDFAELIGSLVFASTALKYSPVYIKNLEREKFLALKRNSENYEARMVLDQKVLKDDFTWWKENISHSFNPIKTFDFKIEIFTDSSLDGWGANIKGDRTHGFWKAEERGLHINILELKAAFFGLVCYAKNLRNCDILLRIDNTTAISYINRMGGIQFPILNGIAREIWQWCERRDLWIFASYIKSKDNVIADHESRVLEPETEFEISEKAFSEIINKFGQPDIDLFASRVNKKCKKYVSWLKDPHAFQIDSFTLNWKPFKFYAFPPFSLVLRVLRKIQKDKALGILVVPFWPTQPWFPVFKSMLLEEPLYFQPNINLLFSSDRKPHPLWNNLTLVAGRLSGEPSP